MSKEVNHSRGMDPVERGIRTNFLRRTAKEAREYRVRMRILTAALATMVLLTSIFFIISALYNRADSTADSVCQLNRLPGRNRRRINDFSALHKARSRRNVVGNTVFGYVNAFKRNLW